MIVRVRLAEVLSPDLLAMHREHIQDFLLQEGITPAADELGQTMLSERQIKELLAELAENLPE